MAVTPVGNRPQAPAQLEATPTAAQKSGGGAVATATATVGTDNAFQTQYARDAFVDTTANANQGALGTDTQQAGNEQSTWSSLANAVQSLAQGLSDLVNSLFGSNSGQGVGQNGDAAQVAPDHISPDEVQAADNPLDAFGGGPGNPNHLGIDGPGGSGTKPGAFGVPGINQNDPNEDGDNSDYKFGQTNCAPTALAEIARGKSLEDPNYSLTWKDANGVTQTKPVAQMSNEELVTTLGKIAKTDKDGTSANGVIDAADAMGLPVTNDEVKVDDAWKPGQGMKSHSFDQNWLDKKLGDGERVVVNGAYEAQDDQGKNSLVGHFMTIAGKNADGTYAVVDPWDGKLKNYDADQLARFMQSNPFNGGVMLAIGDTAAEKAAKGQGQQG